MKLQAKILIVLAPFILVPLGALGWVAYTQQRDSIQQEALRQMETLIEQIERHIQARLDAARANVSVFSTSGVLKRYLLVDDEAQRYQLLQPGLLKLFASYQNAYPEYYEIRVLLPDGYEDTRSTTSPIANHTEEEGDTEHFRQMRESEQDVVIQLVHDTNVDAPALMASRRIRMVDTSVDPINATRKLRGYLVVTMSLDFLSDQAKSTRIGNSGHIFFSDEAGRVLFAPGHPRHGSAIPGTDMRRLLAGAHSGTLLTTEHLGGTYLLRGRQLHDNLYLFTALPEAELLASTNDLAVAAAALTLGTILITTSLLYVFLRSLLLTPLTKLGHAAREIGRGNLEIDLGFQRQDEIGALARSFEEMGRSLRGSHEQISYLAYHDSLTGLPNRRMFAELLKGAVAHARRHGEHLALLFLDVDDFKRVNDSLGHQVGDELLQEVADRFVQAVREYDCVSRGVPDEASNAVARLGGDEFIVLLPSLKRPLDAATVASRLLDAISHHLVVRGHEVHVNASIGITTYPQDGETASQLIKNADIAMYHAKAQGKNHYQFYTESMNIALVEHMALEGALRKAIARHELLLYYQPQVNAHTGAMVGVEALLRWRSPELGMVSPGAFIPLAEETGLIVPIGEWVLQEACRQNQAWQAVGLPPMPVSVNISNRQFSRPQFEETVKNALTASGLEPRYLDIELTETSIMDSPAQAAEILAGLKALGVQISMDDFGTGYSSLSALKRLPIDCLKIDQSFVHEITTDNDDAIIVSTIIAMSKSLNLKVIAEGVERPEQLEFLRENGCDLIQGYLFSKPVPADELTALLESPRLGYFQSATMTSGVEHRSGPRLGIVG